MNRKCYNAYGLHKPPQDNFEQWYNTIKLYTPLTAVVLTKALWSSLFPLCPISMLSLSVSMEHMCGLTNAYVQS